MKVEHKFVLGQNVLEFFAARNARDREQLLKIFRSLILNPYKKGDWTQKTAVGRELQVVRLGPWLIRYWLDDPVLELRIVDVEKLAT